MSYFAEELHVSRRTQGTNDGVQLETKWTIGGMDDEIVARDVLSSAISPVYLDWLTGRTLFIQSHEVTPVGPSLWDGTVSYATVQGQDNQPKPPTFSFDTTGGTTHIGHAISQARYTAAGGKVADDLNGAINVKGDQQSTTVEGVDIVIPALKFSETWSLPVTQVTTGYVNTLTLLTGRTNTSTWRTYGPGCVLFHGATGQSGDDGFVPVTFNFEVSPSLSGLTVAGVAGISKGGFDYIWTYTKSKVVGDVLVPDTVAVYVATVYRTADFGWLGV